MNGTLLNYFPAAMAALGVSGDAPGDGAAGFDGFRRAFLQCHDLLRGGGWHPVCGRSPEQGRLALGGADAQRHYGIYYAIPHLEIFDVRDLIIHDWPAIAWKYYGIAVVYALFYSGLFLTGACFIFRRKALN